MELGFRKVIVMTFGCKKRKTQFTLAKTRKAYWLASEKFTEDLLQSQLDRGTQAMLCHWDFVSVSQSCLLPCWLYFSGRLYPSGGKMVASNSWLASIQLQV